MKVTSFDDDSHVHTIAFSDGDEREIDLKWSKRKWQKRPWRERKAESLS